MDKGITSMNRKQMVDTTVKQSIYDNVVSFNNTSAVDSVHFLLGLCSVATSSIPLPCKNDQ